MAGSSLPPFVSYPRPAGELANSHESPQAKISSLFQRGGHVIFAGNPGVGKSSLLNAIAQADLFPAGFNVGGGLTQVLLTKRFENLHVSDTPGLWDIERKEAAAREIARAISLGGSTSRFFVMTVEAGRIRPQDIATAQLILKSLRDENIEMNQKYGVIINKATSRVLASRGQYAGILAELLGKEGSPYLVMMHKLVVDAMDTNFLMEQPVDLIGQMLLVPAVDIPRNTSVNIKVNEFQALERRIAQLEELLERAQGQGGGVQPLAVQVYEPPRFADLIRNAWRDAVARVTECIIL